MDLQDVTKNQHFVPQVEQRLNSLNPSASLKKQKILSFTLRNRESYSITLDSPKGFKISQTLSLDDIFSFEILKNQTERYNFEKLFQKYEANIRENTESLLFKLKNSEADVKSEVLNIFVSKFLNFIRNPYSIKKVLNTFPNLKRVYPTDPVHYRNFERVLNGRKPQQEYLCKQLGVTKEEYADWLSVIFILLSPLKEGQTSIFEDVVKGLYEDLNSFIMVLIYTYDKKTCLLSDRGYSIPLPEGEHMAWDFNLYSNGFIRYIFGDINSLIPENTPKTIIENFKLRPKSVEVSNIVNDLNALAQYNRHVVYQCHNNVFNSSTECYGL